MTGRWRVHLNVRSLEHTPEEVSHRLDVPGDKTSSVPGRRWPHLWQADSGLASGGELDEHLRALVERFAGRTSRILALATDPGSRVAIEAVLHADPDDSSLPGMWIPPEIIRFAADSGIGIDIDGYVASARSTRF